MEKGVPRRRAVLATTSSRYWGGNRFGPTRKGSTATSCTQPVRTFEERVASRSRKAIRDKSRLKRQLEALAGFTEAPVSSSSSDTDWTSWPKKRKMGPQGFFQILGFAGSFCCTTYTLSIDSHDQEKFGPSLWEKFGTLTREHCETLLVLVWFGLWPAAALQSSRQDCLPVAKKKFRIFFFLGLFPFKLALGTLQSWFNVCWKNHIWPLLSHVGLCWPNTEKWLQGQSENRSFLFSWQWRQPRGTARISA